MASVISPKNGNFHNSLPRNRIIILSFRSGAGNRDWLDKTDWTVFYLEGEREEEGGGEGEGVGGGEKVRSRDEKSTVLLAWDD